ncbi:LOW QUALITY PROTEIN: polycystic kidney disease protein 1-like 2 [Orbicella faveolata]|uniref:LOW QUALITY PROTEIN: polycystic kidney disease protein 1-like 2 n=1 Tax=Orbicella faveolata TaxID=48498 RepID=UPI0009E38B3A|nr:LOW QUALITY PROTEIN: polycystic kidney disease protein 1-like 2 [Orbicella faveolata]
MWIRLSFLLTACQIFYLISALSSPKILYLPPESPDELYLGCYETQNNESNLYKPRLSTINSYKCIEACAYEMFPLAAVLNDTDCHCANDSVTPLIETDPCGGSRKSTNRFEVYNTSCLLVEFVEIYQELTFTTFPPNITPSVSSSLMLVTPSSVTATNSSQTIVYSVDFGDGRSNWTRVLRHHYLAIGEFNITLVASRGNSTIFVLSRRIRILSRAKVANVSCSAIKPNHTVVCKLNGLRGSDITASIAMYNTGQNVSLLVPDVPRLVIGSTGVPITNQSAAKNESGAYLLPSLQFITEATVEAWEVYAESPGRIQLQIYRAILNLTKCKGSRYQHSSCGDWTPANGDCNQVCIKLIYRPKLSIVSCGRTISSYSKVYSIDTNLTVGYNLIVIPQEQRFITREGDIVGFYRNTSGAVIQTITAGQDIGGYFFPAQDMSNLDIKNGITSNVSFRVKLHSSAEVKAELAFWCSTSVGLYSLTSTFHNALSSYNDSKALTFRSFISVQNAIAQLDTQRQIYIEVNSTEVFTANVTQGTNVSCEWYIPNSSLTAELQSPYLKNNTTTEGGVFQYSFLYRFTGYIPLVVTAYNLVSKERRTLNLFVRQPIKGLKANMCNGEFAYNNAQTCFNSSVTRGTDVGCTWVFKQPPRKKDDCSKKKIGETIFRGVDHVERPNLFRFRWNWDGKSNLEEASSIVTHTFTEPGQYFITVNISSTVDHVVLDGHVTVQQRIEGLLIRDLAVKSSNVLHVKFEILQGTNVTCSVEYGDETEAQLGFLRTLPEIVELTHQYSEPGTYGLSISVNSIVGPSTSVQKSVVISEAPCVLDGLRMLGAGESSAQCPEIQQEYEYSLYSSLKINCQAFNELKYDWKVENILNGSVTEVSSFPKDILSSNVLFLAARSLQGGLYRFTLSVTAIPLGISKVATGFLRVRTPKLLAVIDCGRERVMSWNHEIILNASSSRDPNNINVGKASDSLSFEWFCDANRSVSCFKSSVNNKSTLIFPPESLDVNASYEFFVVVTKGMRQAEASQIIKVVAGSFPPLCVRCKENCAYKVTASKEFILSGEGCQDNKNTDCKWELYGPPLLNGQISKRSVESSRLISVSYAKEFHLDPSNLIPNRTYTIFFNNNRSGFWAQYSVTTDMPPTGGSCVVSPSEGVVIETQFQISCTEWTDEDSPLWYEFFLSHPVHGSMLLFYGWMPDSVGLFLPAGSKDNDFNVDLFVKITDVLGSYRIVPLQAKVKSFSPKEGSVSSILKGVVSGPDSMLEKLLAVGEFQQASQLMTTVITVLNEDSTKAHDSESPDTKDRVEVRSRVIEGLSQQCCSSPQSIQQALGGLLQAVGVTAELSPDANVDGANAFSNMAQALVIKFKSVRAANETRGIIDGLNIVMRASVDTSNEVKLEQSSDEIKDWIDDSNEARNKQYQEKCEKATNKSLEGVKYAAQKILDYQRKGDPPSHVTSGLMKLTLARQSPSDIDNATLDGGEVTFQFPWNVTIDKLKQFDTVNTKVITMSQTPFISNDAIPIDTPVSTLELLETSGKEIEIRNLTEPVSIFLSLNQSENDDLDNMTGVIDSEMNITVFKIESGGDNSFYFTVSCSGAMNTGQELILVLKRNSKPTANNFDLRWNLTLCNSTLKKLISREYLNNSEGLYLGVKLAEASNLTNGTSTRNEIHYAVSVKAIGCYYWNERMQAWRADGCEVGPLTTLERVECRCNHLTWFGSRVFVPPNKLHLDIILKRIKDPSNYAPVLSVLCVTFGLYLMVIVWARREDRKDRNKTGLTVSPSNRAGDAHAYEVVISTGMRRHAGTTANVAMTITGERGESHPYLLKNSRRMALARGSTDSFLVTTSETLGELTYIRVWHDNFGKDPAWFVKQISIREIDTDGVWYFVCESWLAVDEGDGMIDRIFPVASNAELKEFRRLFLTKAYKDLTDSHLWFSVVWRPPQSPFTRVQRVSCCLSLLLCTMMANALWYEADKGRYTAVELGPFEFSWEQVSIGICSSLVVFPINLLLVQIFRHCRPRPVPKLGLFNMKIRPRSLSTHTEITLVKFRSRDSCNFGTSFPTSQYQNVHKGSPGESPNSRDKISLSPAMRFGLMPSFSVSLGAGATTDSTNDIRSLLPSDSLSGSPTRDHENTFNTAGEEDTSRAKGLPWWFVYVGWFLVTVTSLTAATVTLLYGIEFGLKKSSQWLLSMFFSLTQDIFVSQPLKVLALATFFAYIFKKRNKIALSSPSRLTSDEHWLQNQLQHSEDDFEEHPKAPPVEVPTEDALRHARDRAQKERTMHTILLDLGTFLVFTFLVLLIAYGFRDRDAFRQNDAVAKVLLRQNFSGKQRGFFPDRYSQIIRQRDMWDWTENALLPSLYNLPSYFYTGKAPKFMEGESGLVVGVARLRQHRVKKDSCSVAPVAKDFFLRCVAEYGITSEDKQAYSTRWESLINDSSHQTQTSLSPGPWHYSAASELDGYPYIGGIATYSGGGYVLELSHIYYKALRQVKDARDKLWLDHYTRSLFMEFTLYNPNSNLFCAVTFVMETFPTGGVFPHSEVIAYRLYRYVGDFQLFVLACEVLFFAFILYFTYREAKKLYKTRRMYFAEVWNLMDLTVLILCWIAIAYYFICLGLRKWTINLYHKDPTKFISFQHVSTWQLMFEILLQYYPRISEVEELYSTSIANCVFNSFLCYTTIMLNIVTIHAIRETSSLPKTLKTLLLSLAVSDVGVGLFGQPFYISLLVKWLQQNDPGCNLYKAFDIIVGLFSTASFLGVVAVSVDRFLAIHLHLRYREFVTHKRVVAMVISIWVLSAYFSLIPFWAPPDIRALILSIGTVIGLLLTTLVYIRIYLAVRRHKNQIQVLQVQNATQTGAIANFAEVIKSSVETFYVYLVFLVCYLPIFITSSAFQIINPSIAWKRFLLFSLTLIFVNSSLNPVIYCWKMRHIRHAVMNILRNMSSHRNLASH